jgi:hypothetical protein
MAQKRERPPSISPPPITMPWMRNINTTVSSLLSNEVNRPVRSQLLQNSEIMKPQTGNNISLGEAVHSSTLEGYRTPTTGEQSRLDKANIIRFVTD